MFRRSGAMVLAANVALLGACGATRSPERAADTFVDKYYVEADQEAALALADGLARVRLQAEMKLVGDSRRGLAPGSHAAKVYYDRKSLEGQGGARVAEYALHIKPQGASGIERIARLELRQLADGTWRVVGFSETAPR